MEDYEVEEALLEIASIHESFDTNNPNTFRLLLAMHKDKLNEEQVKFINSEIERLTRRMQSIADKWLARMGDVARLPITEANKEAV